MNRLNVSYLAHKVVLLARQKHMLLTTAESCTGGLLAAALTGVRGVSDVFAGGFITYSNDMKRRILGVSSRTLYHYGAVSKATARSMAKKALDKTSASMAISVTGIAGPAGGSVLKPVGLVHFAVARKLKKRIAIYHEKHIFRNLGRNSVRQAAVRQALKMLAQHLK